MRSELRAFSRSKHARRDRRVTLFTSLEGTLLDSQTFDPGPAGKVVRELVRSGVPLVPVTVMTLAEVEPIAARLGIQHPMIIEAGGAIARKEGDGWTVEAYGPPADAVLEAIRAIEESSGAQLAVFSVQPERIAALISGRSGEMLRAAVDRYFSEPFLIERGSFGEVQKSAKALGFTVRRAGRFFFLCREGAEVEAFRRLRDEIGSDITIGVGSSMIDAAFLQQCDVAIVIPSGDKAVDGELLRAVPGAIVAPCAGPSGWATAVSEARQAVDAGAA